MNLQNYGARPIKPRRTKEDILALKVALHSILRDDHPQTVRGVFYQAVTRGLIAKTEAEYKNVITRLLGEMRKDGVLPFEWIADNTRWMRKPATYSGLDQLMRHAWRFYRKSMWVDQPVYCEIWVEKEALAGVMYEATETWDVPLMVTRGYPSLSFLHTASQAIANNGKDNFIYYFGDYDPSGLDISHNVEMRLREFAPDADIVFERVAVTREQIELFHLPTRPTKKTDTRAKGFQGESVELDAIPSHDLRDMVAACVSQHLDADTLDGIFTAEQAERETLGKIAEHFKMM